MVSANLIFIADDDVSMNMPGMKDFISLRNENGQRIHIQKRLVLSNLKETYELFRSRYPDNKIGFSMFASLRPKHCVLAGSSGTHTVCVCSIHQNVKLMMLGGNFGALTSDRHKPLNRYGDCLDLIICENPTSACYLGHCINCPNEQILKEILNEALESNEVKDVKFKRWVSKPRTTLDTVIQSSFEFIDNFYDNLMTLLPHFYIAKEQARFLRSLKESFQENEFLIICDFAENYAFVVQDAAPGFHWNNNQATVFPVVVYFRSNNELIHRSLVIISDCTTHDSIAVHVFCIIINQFIKTLAEKPIKIYCFSDGAPQQFKNYKNFQNVYFHQDDFGISAEWHFFATAHGKGPCDGVGGTLKRMAARASLQSSPDKQILTAEELYNWARKPNTLPNITVKFSSKIDYNTEKLKQELRFTLGKKIPATHKLHCVIPSTNGMIIVKQHSFSNEYETHNILKKK